jgi:hypothetical protein
MSEVFLKRGDYKEFLRAPYIILEGFKEAGFNKNLEKNACVGLKIHFGEKGNKSYLKPPLLLPLVKFLKEEGAVPFLFETNTLYRGKRMNAIDHINLAKSHGFGRLNIPIIIGDGIRGNDYIEVEINKKHFSTCFLAYSLKDIDFLLVLSHFTCHMLTGFGAAIKSVGMGCASRKGKLAQHSQVSPEIQKDKCVVCGICADNCPVEAIERRDKYFIISDKCIGCAQCISICPQGAVKIVWSEDYELLGEKMVEYAFACTNKVKTAYINFCLYITKECDCMNKEDKGFIADYGVLFSWDPLSIDKASVDLLLQREKKDILKEVHPKINYLHYLQYAQELGLGSLDYKLIEI